MNNKLKSASQIILVSWLNILEKQFQNDKILFIIPLLQIKQKAFKACEIKSFSFKLNALLGSEFTNKSGND
jgi:hypothetical protein